MATIGICPACDFTFDESVAFPKLDEDGCGDGACPTCKTPLFRGTGHVCGLPGKGCKTITRIGVRSAI